MTSSIIRIIHENDSVTTALAEKERVPRIYFSVIVTIAVTIDDSSYIYIYIIREINI